MIDTKHYNRLMIRQIFLLCALTICASGLRAQQIDTLRISLQTTAKPLSAVLTQIEEQTHIRIFCPAQYSSLTVPALSEQKTQLGQVLHRVLENTDLDYFTYRDYAIFVGPKAIVQTDFSADYYQALALAKQSTTTPPPTRDDDIPVIDLVVGDAKAISANGRALVRATVKDQQGEEIIVGAAVIFPNLKGKNAATDRLGRYEQVLPIGKHAIKVQYPGFEPFEGSLTVWNDGEVQFQLIPASNALAEVLIKAEGNEANVNKAQIGVTKLDPKMIKKLPTLLGEADVVRSLLLSTGVTSVGEGASGFNVRGGDTDQNLTLQGEMILFNTSHALGFFSTYNTDLVSKVELYKSIMPAEFGGRLASVLDVQMTEGNFEHWQLKSGIGIVSGRIGAEGPIVKNKTAMAIGIR